MGSVTVWLLGQDRAMSTLRQTPLTCSGHTRPVVFLAFSNINAEGQYYSISACKDGKPMLRSGDTGDWIGTFEGHKGAVWGVDINKDATKAATGAADFSAKVWDALSGEEDWSLARRVTSSRSLLDTRSSSLMPTGLRRSRRSASPPPSTPPRCTRTEISSSVTERTSSSTSLTSRPDWRLRTSKVTSVQSTVFASLLTGNCTLAAVRMEH